MFKIIQTEAERPITLIAAPWAIFQPGMAAQLVEVDGLLVCDVSNGNNPIGIIDSVKKRKYKNISYDKKKLVHVWTQRAKFSTDQYEQDVKYKVGDGLYISKRGLFTTQKLHPDAYPVARLTTEPTEKYPCLEALWI